ncbi:MAG: DUF192 domain-containing protein [Candidatus Doudnabacteria bacterium]|nr:DUF192 domain-containing protein [Candidatus Doudnabacteria bacterium]
MWKLALSVALILAVIVMVQLARETSKQTMPTQYDDGIIQLAGQTLNIELAKTAQKQRIGLGGRDSIGENEGMLFVYNQAKPHGFWMKGMLMPIDIIWIDGNRIVDISAEVQPQPGASDRDLQLYSPKSPADKVLEVSSGWAKRNGLTIGDVVQISLP